MKMKKFLEIIAIIVFLLLLIATIYSYQTGGIIYSLIAGDTVTVIQYLSSFGWATEIIFIFLIILEVVFAPLPPLILYLVAGIMFGGWIGGLLALIGNILGATIDFWIARHFGRYYIEKKVPKRFKKKFNEFLSRYGTVSIFLLRINPITTSDLFSYLAGLSEMRYLGFIIATILGLIPYVFIQSFLGDVFTENNLLFNIFLIASFIYIILFFVIFILIKHNKKQ